MISLYINTIDSLSCESLGFSVSSFSSFRTCHNVDAIIIISRDLLVLGNSEYYLHDKLHKKG